MTNYVSQPGVRTRSNVRNGSTAATGPLLTYTCPANKTATLTSYGSSVPNAAVQLAARITTTSGLFDAQAPAAGARVLAEICAHQLNAGDTFAVQIIAAVAATTADAFISLFEEL